VSLRSKWFTVPVLVLLALALIPVPTRAQEQNFDRDKFDRDRRDRGRFDGELRGVVVSIDRWGRSFRLQERSRFDSGIWLVVVDRRTDFDVRRGRDRYDDDHYDDDRYDDRGRDWEWFRRLDVGDFVEVEGRLIRYRTILAREIDVLRPRRPIVGRPHPQPYPQPYPQPPVVIVPAPVIIFPRHGVTIFGGGFVLSGRVGPRARVLIVVSTMQGGATYWKHEMWADADDSGAFRVPIQSGYARYGVQHHITVRSVQGGAESPPVTVVVNQN